VVGFDDIPWAEYGDPPLTTVRLDAQELARKTCFVLMDLLDGKEVSQRRQILDTELVIRKSCTTYPQPAKGGERS
jgi:DNA-binding LacI/PurR family transcriptional regulator